MKKITSELFTTLHQPQVPDSIRHGASPQRAITLQLLSLTLVIMRLASVPGGKAACDDNTKFLPVKQFIRQSGTAGTGTCRFEEGPPRWDLGMKSLWLLREGIHPKPHDSCRALRGLSMFNHCSLSLKKAFD